jgi:hypothetical protein
VARTGNVEHHLAGYATSSAPLRLEAATRRSDLCRHVV